MVPFKRTQAEFTGEESRSGHDLTRYTGTKVEIVRMIQQPNDDHDGHYDVRMGGKTYAVYGDDLHPHPDARPTNEEFMAHLMAWATTPMTHAFIFDAICKHADRILSDEAAVHKAMAGSLIGSQTWIDSAREARDAVNEHLSR
jgi:hypothetical protein